MKLTTRILLGLGGAGLLYAFFGNTWDYGLNCTRCCYYEHRIQRVFGRMPFYEFTMNTEPGYDRAYNDLFGKPCTHVMKKGGFGRNPGCGMTAEGTVFWGRNKAVKAVFEAYLRTQSHSLAQESFSLVEKLFPERISVMSYHDGNREDTNQTTIGEMALYGEWLNLVETPEEWRLVNESALRDFATPPAFLSDEKLMHNKINSSSSIVRDAAEDTVKYPAQRD